MEALQFAPYSLSAAAWLAAVYCIYRSLRGRRVGRLDPDGLLYAAGILLAGATLLSMLYTLSADGPGINAGLQLTLCAAAVIQLAETFREYVPFGQPWGYQGG